MSALEWDVGIRGVVWVEMIAAECITERGDGGTWVGVDSGSNAEA